MVSWLDELDRREAAARQEVAELRDQIEELTSRLAEREDVLSRLQITRETMTEILSGSDETVSVGGAETDAGDTETEEHRLPSGSPVRVRLVPHWTPELAVGVLPGSYRDIVEVLQDAVHPMRAHHLCAALGLSTDKSKVEGFRSKLKRLYVLPRGSPPIRKVRAPRGVGCGSETAAVRGSTSLAARHPTTTRPPIGKCEQVAA